MAESGSYLQYEDGFVLHNGLPVRWKTEMGDTYDIILHFSQDWTGGYTGFAALQQNVHNDFQYAHSYKLLPNDGERGYFGKKHQLSRKYTTSAATHTKAGSNSAAMKAADPLSPAETFWFGSGNNIPCTAVVFPYVQNPSADFYVGLNTTAISAIDFTNHGSGGHCEVVQMYVPDMTNMPYSLNASNFSALRNIYGPKVTNGLNCFLTYDDEFSGGIKPKVFENIYLPSIINSSATFYDVSEVKNTCINGSTIEMDNNGIVNGFTGGELIAYRDVDISNATARYGITARNSTATNVSSSRLSAYNSTISNAKLSTNSNVGSVSANFENTTATNVSGIFNQVYNSSLGSWSTSATYVSAKNSEFNGLTASTFIDAGGGNKITNLKLNGGHGSYYGNCSLKNTTTADGNFNIYNDAILSGTVAGDNFTITVGNNISANSVTGIKKLSCKRCGISSCSAGDISANYSAAYLDWAALIVSSDVSNVNVTGAFQFYKSTADSITQTISPPPYGYSNRRTSLTSAYVHNIKTNGTLRANALTADDIYCAESLEGSGYAINVSAGYKAPTFTAEHFTQL